MGSLIGHVAPGFGFLVIGLWHLYNHLKLLALKGRHYHSLPWFPSAFLRHLELYLIMIATALSVSMELFIGPDRHQPLDPDGTIPSNHLHNFEHSSISLTFFLYATFAFALDRYYSPHAPPNPNPNPNHHHDVLQFIGGIAFAQQLLLFHLHSADHMGVEGQYHWLLQLVVFVSLFTTLLGIGHPTSFITSFARSLSILFQGVWLMVMGFALWTPSLIAKGCFIHLEDGHQVVHCDGHKSLHRAKALVNLQFSWFLILLALFGGCFYVFMITIYRAHYAPISEHEHEHEDEDEDEDVEAQKMSPKFTETQSFVNSELSNNKANIHHHMER